MDGWTVFYGVISLAVVGIAWLSDDHAIQKIGMLLLFAWATTNVAVEFLGFQEAPILIPSIDAMVAILTAIIGYRTKSRVALVVFLLYVSVALIHVGAYMLRKEGVYTYYAILNLFFLAQLITVGGAGAWMALSRRSFVRGERARAGAARWPRMG